MTGGMLGTVHARVSAARRAILSLPTLSLSPPTTEQMCMEVKKAEAMLVARVHSNQEPSRIVQRRDCLPNPPGEILQHTQAEYAALSVCCGNPRSHPRQIRGHGAIFPVTLYNPDVPLRPRVRGPTCRPLRAARKPIAQTSRPSPCTSRMKHTRQQCSAELCLNGKCPCGH